MVTNDNSGRLYLSARGQEYTKTMTMIRMIQNTTFNKNPQSNSHNVQTDATTHANLNVDQTNTELKWGTNKHMEMNLTTNSCDED